MKKLIGRLKTRDPMHSSGKTIVLLIATLLMVMGLQMTLHAGTHQFLFDADAIKDPGSFVVKLQDTRALVSEWIASQLSEDMQWVLLGYNGTSTPSPQQQEVLLSDLNRAASSQVSLRCATVR